VDRMVSLLPASAKEVRLSSKTIRIGFVGCGVVGTGVGDLAFSCGDD